MPTMKGSKSKRKLDDRVVVITGANSGIGKECAMDMSKRGARVIMLCRDVTKAQTVADEIKKESNGIVEIEKLDLASLVSVRECAKKLLDKEERIDILLNNAGVMLCPNWKTEEGFDMQLGTNHLGHFLLTEMLMPLVRKSAELGNKPRIVIVSSLAHEYGKMHWKDLHFEKSYNATDAYNQSKLANVLHAKELSRRLEGTGINVYSLHPGVINTELARHMTSWYMKAGLSVAKPFLKTPLQGAQTSIFCCVDDSVAGDSGKYYSGCKEKTAAKRARSEDDQKRLWEISERLVGLKEE